MNDLHTQAGSSKPSLSRVTLLLSRLQGSLQGRLGKSPTYSDMEEWTGAAEATVKDWFNNRGRPSAEFLLDLLDRVSQESRHEAIDRACKVWPTIDDPRLKCDRTVISQLKTVIRQTNGLTIIYGGTDESRTFVLTALGNAFLALTERPRRVVGIDVHESDWFVPVPGVDYLHNVNQPSRLEEAVRRVWPEIRADKSRLILLNGIWSVLPNLQKQITSMASRCHIIVADATTPKPSQGGLAKIPINLIAVSGGAQNILVEVRAG